MQVTLLTVDLTKIRGKGDFRCPRCGVRISPDDSTEETYSILEPVMKGDSLEKILMQCNKCGSKIYLTGFYRLNLTR
jgi:DNA-directed RNA polymerase subunit RPC12/RpoP